MGIIYSVVKKPEQAEAILDRMQNGPIKRMTAYFLSQFWEIEFPDRAKKLRTLADSCN